MERRMQLTVSQAARAARKSKGQISRMVKSGRISADRDEDGRPRIDASELLRVYPNADLEKRDATAKQETREKQETHNDNSAVRAQLELMREERDRLIAELDRERRERNQDREKAVEREEWLKGQVETTQRLLEDHRAKSEPSRGFWSRIWP
jgi:hypothetical protein